MGQDTDKSDMTGGEAGKDTYDIQRLKDLIAVPVPRLPDAAHGDLESALSSLSERRKQIGTIEKEIRSLPWWKRLFGAARRRRTKVSGLREKLVAQDTVNAVQGIVRVVKEHSAAIASQVDLVQSAVALTLQSYLDRLKDYAELLDRIGDVRLRSLLDSLRVNKALYDGLFARVFRSRKRRVLTDGENALKDARDEIRILAALLTAPFYKTYKKIMKGQPSEAPIPKDEYEAAGQQVTKKYEALLSQYGIHGSSGEPLSHDRLVRGLYDKMPSQAQVSAFSACGEENGARFLWVVFMGVVKKHEVIMAYDLMEHFLTAYLTSSGFEVVGHESLIEWHNQK